MDGMITVRPYNLPDHLLLEKENSPAFMVWQPEREILVLGQSNRVETSIDLEAVIRDGIQVVKRPSGGETVLLTPNTLCISFTFRTEGFENPTVYFKTINACIIAALERLGVRGLAQKGISDISYGEMKILGSSIYRKRDRVLYHAVLNVAETAQRIATYIRHPQKEPDYRKGRTHEDFVTSLRSLGCNATMEEFRQVLSSALEACHIQ
jgi:lipoate-protein ligase A